MIEGSGLFDLNNLSIKTKTKIIILLFIGVWFVKHVNWAAYLNKVAERCKSSQGIKITNCYISTAVEFGC